MGIPAGPETRNPKPETRSLRLPTPRHIPPLGFSGLTRIYEPFQRLVLGGARVQRRLLDLAGPRPGERSLELGCGTGVLTELLTGERRQGPVLALDPDVPALAQVAAKGLPGCQLLRGSATELPVAAASVDRVLSSLAFHHLSGPQKRAAVREARRVLRPGGVFAVADFGRAASWWMRLAFVPVQLLDGFETTGDSVAGRLEGYLEDAGFASVEVAERWSTVFGTVEFLVARA